jgi:hypothetical protein
MGDWITVKKQPKKTARNQPAILSKNKIPSKKDIDIVFEETYDLLIDEGMEDILYDIKPHSLLLSNVYSSDLTDFFYNYFDKKRTVNIIPDKEADNNEYCSDDEYY